MNDIVERLRNEELRQADTYEDGEPRLADLCEAAADAIIQGRALADDLWAAYTRLYHACDVTHNQVDDFHAAEARYRKAKEG